MQSVLTSLRKKYFTQIAKLIPKVNAQFIVLTHILEDRPELLAIINDIAPINLLIGIPYSIHQPTLVTLNKQYKCITPDLQQLQNNNYLISLFTDHIDVSIPTIVLEIGGYFASVLKPLQHLMQGNLMGVIEDTEVGHRKYEENREQLPCPVISIARSQLKETEDFLIGSSCLYSTEKLLRACGLSLEGKQSLVLGYGKIGRGVAHALRRRHCSVAIFDIDPIKRITALSEGFNIPDRAYALSQADMIFGATGTTSIKHNDFTILCDNTLLVSCSSRDIEFDLPYLIKNYRQTPILDALDHYRNSQHSLYLAANGCPVNFIDGAVIGPMLALVQAEMIISIKELLTLKGHTGLFEVGIDTKSHIAEEWLHCFCHELTGCYQLNSDSESSRVQQWNKDNEQYVSHE